MVHFKYSERLTRDPAPEIVELYGKPHIELEQESLQFHLAIHKAHCVMLHEQGILDRDTARQIIDALTELQTLGAKALNLRPELNDLFTNTEVHLIEKLGESVGGRLHTGRSRNDFNLTVARMEARAAILDVMDRLLELQGVLLECAETHVETVMPGYTHISQQAQPVTLGHFLAAFFDVFDRDIQRLGEAYAVVDRSSMGGVALAGTGFPINRRRVSDLLGFSNVVENTIDATGSRDFQLQTLAALGITASSLARLAESLLIWNMGEIGMIDLPDEYCSISSIMPQKKNPVALETVRAEVSLVLGRLASALAILKASPLGNSREVGYTDRLVEETGKEVALIIPIMAGLLRGMRVDREVMFRRAAEGFSTTTELADELVRVWGVPFRKAHRIVGYVVGQIALRGGTARDISAEAIAKACADLYGDVFVLSADLVATSIDPAHNVRMRKTLGGPAPSEVKRMLRDRSSVLSGRRADVANRREVLATASRALESAVASLMLPGG